MTTSVIVLTLSSCSNARQLSTAITIIRYVLPGRLPYRARSGLPESKPGSLPEASRRRQHQSLLRWSLLRRLLLLRRPTNQLPPSHRLLPPKERPRRPSKTTNTSSAPDGGGARRRLYRLFAHNHSLLGCGHTANKAQTPPTIAGSRVFDYRYTRSVQT